MKTGEKAEAQVLASLVSNGYPVLTPFGDNQPYDIVVQDGREFLKIQVKSSTTKDGCIVADLRHTNMTSQGPQHRHYSSDEVDIYAVYSSEENNVYWVPFEETPKTEIRLRVDKDIDPRMENRVNWASDYEL